MYKTFVNSIAASPIIDLTGSNIIFALCLFRNFLTINLYLSDFRGEYY